MVSAADLDHQYETLWARLDEIQARISALVALPADRQPTEPWFEMSDFAALAAEERFLFTQIDNLGGY